MLSSLHGPVSFFLNTRHPPVCIVSYPAEQDSQGFVSVPVGGVLRTSDSSHRKYAISRDKFGLTANTSSLLLHDTLLGHEPWYCADIQVCIKLLLFNMALSVQPTCLPFDITTHGSTIQTLNGNLQDLVIKPHWYIRMLGDHEAYVHAYLTVLHTYVLYTV